MERQEIISGLKHAIERGYSLEMAIQSFINAGYNSQDVQDSAKLISGGVISSMDIPQLTQQPTQQPNPQKIQPPQQPPLPKIQPQIQPTPQLPKIPIQVQPRNNPYQYPQQTRQPMQQPIQQPIPQSRFPILPTSPIPDINPQKEPSNILIIILVIVLVLLLGVLGLLLFARTTILSWFS